MVDVMFQRTARTALYCRGRDTARQERACRALADRLGWQATGLYADGDVPARGDRPRPAWQRLLADIDTGAVGAVICWNVDRPTRDLRELNIVRDLADRGLGLATCTGVDLAAFTRRRLARMVTEPAVR